MMDDSANEPEMLWGIPIKYTDINEPIDIVVGSFNEYEHWPADWHARNMADPAYRKAWRRERWRLAFWRLWYQAVGHFQRLLKRG